MPSQDPDRDVEELRHRLEETEAVVEALRDGSVDAMVSGAGLVGFAGAERPYRAFFEAMNEGGLTLDAAGHILHCNPRFAALVDASIDQLRHRPFQDFVAAADRERVARLLASSGGATSEVGLLNAAGHPQPVLLSMTRLELSHQLINCVVVTDLREQRATALAAIQESETKYRLLAENATDCIFWIDAYGRYRYLSPASLPLTGYTPEEFVANPDLMLNIIHPEDRAAYLAHLILDEEGTDTAHLHFRIIRRDGELCWISHACRPMQDDAGRYIGRRGSNHDITERKHAELALRESEDRLARFFDNTASLVWIKDLQGRFVKANSYTLDILGRSAADVIGHTVAEIFPKDEADAYAANDGLVIASGKQHTFEETAMFAEGLHTFFSTKFPLADQDGQLYGIGAICTDITERKRAELAISQSERRFHDIVSASADCIWEVDATGRYTYVSDSMERMLGYTPAEILGKTPFDLMPPGEAERVRVEFMDACGRKAMFRDLHNINLHKDGSQRHLQSNGMPILAPDGSLLGYRGLDRDITDRKIAEADLRQSEQRFRVLFEEAPLGINVVATDGRPVHSNKALSRLLGYSEAEMRQHHFRDWTHPDDIEPSMRLVQRLRDGEVNMLKMEKRYIRKDGGIIWAITSVAAVRDADGNVDYFITLVEDITARKAAEVELKARNEELERFNRASIGRELVMIEMKKTINALSRELGREPPYALEFLKGEPEDDAS